MINKITKALTNLLYSHFGDGYKYYIERLEQGFTTPAFYISLVDSNHEFIISGDSLALFEFSILYFPDSKNKLKNECFDVSNRLIEILADVEVNGVYLHAPYIKSRVVDDVLIIDVNYQYHAIAENEQYENAEFMEDLYLNLEED